MDDLAVNGLSEIASPALLIFPRRVRENLRRMITMARGVDHLRPHVKTHKMAELISMQLEMGITKFKCATISEAEMLAGCGAPDVLLAYQPVGLNISRLIALVREFPATSFKTIVDSEDGVSKLSVAVSSVGVGLGILLDIDCGMHRSGMLPDSRAIDLYRKIGRRSWLTSVGIHAYDGHINDSAREARERMFSAEMAPVFAFLQHLLQAGFPVSHRVFGGTSTFSLHAQTGGSTLKCSPGNCVLWDFGYSDAFGDMDFLHSIAVFTRVISKPGKDLLCLDLGYKAILSDQPHPRVRFIGVENDWSVVGQHEEHLLIEWDRADRYAVGDGFLGIPRHACPTVALYGRAVVVEAGEVIGDWKIASRNRKLRF